MGEGTRDRPAPAEARLAELARVTGRSVDDLTTEAVDRLVRSYLGDPVNGPQEPMAPFSKEFSDLPAEVVVRQVTPAWFELREPIRYVARGRRFDIPMGDISDFASVPRFLTWLIPRYGQHTMAALLHDHLQRHVVTAGDARLDDPERVTAEEADTIFREALAASRVPFLRRWVLWAAVALRTVFRGSAAGAVGVVLWCLSATVLGAVWPLLPLVAAASAAVTWRAPLLAVAAAFGLPVLASGLWGYRWRVGLITGPTLALIALPSLLVLLSGGVYLAVEALVRGMLDEPTALVVTPRRPRGRPRSGWHRVS